MATTPNQLIDETSPYLLQHALNPVDWHPWGDEALALAAAQDKPLLVSIGYAACHWCHVMERESFQDAEIARVMNEWFVCVKVDREERPDIDAVYMAAVQALTGRGGWPMTVFCTPQARPFFAGTYFPPDDRHGIPSFRRVMEAIRDSWVNRRQDLESRSEELTAHLAQALPARDDEPDPQITQDAARTMLESHDSEWGGFGTGMKFPQASALEFLLRMRDRIPGAREALRLTLDRMARGGIFDQLGGGFHRYSVDRVWLVPHFEKMLYDNALLLRLYARAWQAFESEEFRRTAASTGTFLLREMRQSEGGFSSSLDADSEGVEGRYYVWPYEELIASAGDDMPLAIAAFAAAGNGNWEKTNVLWRPHTDEEIAAQTSTTVEEVRAAIARASHRLFEARRDRARPATDDKVLAGWNGLAIAGLAEAGRTLARADFIQAAAGAADFVLTRMRTPDGRLCRSWRGGRTSGPAYLEDYAMMADGCLTLYETTFDPRWWDEALGLARDLLALFADHEGAGFYDTGSDVPTLLVRPKDLVDGAVACGNSAAAGVLLRITALSGDRTFEEAAAPYLRAVAEHARRSPLGFGSALCALDRYARGSIEIAIVGDLAASGTRELIKTAWSACGPDDALAAGPQGSTEPALLRGRTEHDGRAAAYVCRDFACNAPATESAALRKELVGQTGRSEGRR
ncbi:MAG: thioredoxin domain-containing protein [Actinomycetota bacterium]